MMIRGNTLLETKARNNDDDDDDVTNTVYDARSELYRDVTSGERNFLSSLSSVTSDDNSQTSSTSTNLFHRLTTPSSSSTSSSSHPPPNNNNTHPPAATPPNPHYHHLYHPPGLSHDTTIDRSTYASILNTAENPNVSTPDAAYILALIHLYGLYRPASVPEATRWFRTAAAKNHFDAQCALGILAMEEERGDDDEEEAIRWFRRAVGSRSRKDDRGVGYWLLADALYRRRRDADDEKEAWMALSTAATMKIPAALHRLAVMYEYGRTPEEKKMVDFSKAKNYYEMASDGGYHESSYHLGLMYAYGRGVRRDFVVAKEFFRRGAVEGRHVRSMKYLGLLAMRGYGEEGGVCDYEGALFWFETCEMSAGGGGGGGVEGVGDSCATVKEMLRVAMKSAEENEQMIINQFTDMLE